MNDYELVYYAQENNDIAYNMLYKKYKPLLYSFINSGYKYYKNARIDKDDVYIQILFTFNKAVNSFSDKEGYLFSTYLTKCIKTKIYDIYKKNKKIADNEMSIDDTDDGNNILDNIEATRYIPEEYINKMSLQEIIDRYENLSKLEREILNYKINGYKTSDIAIILDKTEKSIYNTISRIRIKLKSVINE